MRIQCRRLTDKLRSLNNAGEMAEEDRRRLNPGQPFAGILPRFYGAPKIHKVGPLHIRPIVSNVDIYCDKLLIHLKAILNLVFVGEFSVRNSYHFVERINQLQIGPNHRLASFDVESLFTNVPVPETLDIVKRRLERMRQEKGSREAIEEITSLTDLGILTLLQFVLNDFYFVWHGELYKQRKGLPMGSRLSPVLANIFLEEMEQTVLASLRVQPTLYVGFVDDVFIIYDSEICDLGALLQLFNDQHPDIRMTSELENNGNLPFLDLMVARTGETHHSIKLSIYRKPTNSHRFLHFKSSHPINMKRNVFRGLWL